MFWLSQIIPNQSDPKSSHDRHGHDGHDGHDGWGRSCCFTAIGWHAFGLCACNWWIPSSPSGSMRLKGAGLLLNQTPSCSANMYWQVLAATCISMIFHLNQFKISIVNILKATEIISLGPYPWNPWNPWPFGKIFPIIPWSHQVWCAVWHRDTHLGRRSVGNARGTICQTF